MPACHQLQLPPAFGQGDVERAFAVPGAFQKELHGERGLARAGAAFIEVHPVGIEATAQNVVQAGVAG